MFILEYKILVTFFRQENMKQILRLTSIFTTQETHKQLIYIFVERKWQKSSELWRKNSRKRALMCLESLSSETSIIILCLRMICPSIQILQCLLWHNDKVFISQDHLIYWGKFEILMINNNSLAYFYTF